MPIFKKILPKVLTFGTIYDMIKTNKRTVRRRDEK